MQRQIEVSAQLSPKEGHTIWVSIPNEAQSQGLTDSTVVRTAMRLTLLSILFASTLYLAWTVNEWPLLIALTIGLSLLMSQFAFVGHDAGHGTISRNSKVNRLFGQYSMTFIAGMCFDSWFKTHKAHHQFCQNEDKDPDMAVSLVVSLTEKSSRNKSALGQFFTRFQHLHIWFLSLFFAHSQRHLTQLDAVKWRFLLDGLVSLAHILLWFAVPYWILDVSLGRILFIYFVPAFVLGPHLAGIFWINHIGMPLVDRQETFSFLEHQAVTSRTVQVPRGARWLFGGLDLQIEHHILSQVPSHRLRRLQTIVINQFEQHGIPYRADSWWDAIIAIRRHLRAVSQLRQGTVP